MGTCKKKIIFINIFWCVGVIFLSIIAVVASIRIWELDLTVMPSVGGDVTLGVFLVKSIQQNRLWGLYENSMVGAPGISSLADVPFLDLDMAIGIWIINLVVGNCVETYYLFYFLTYGTVAGAMFLLLNYLDVKNRINFVISFVYAVAPYHFYRGMWHMTLSNYWIVPLGIYLAFVILERKKNIKVIPSLGVAVLVGMGNIYYVFFALIVMAVAFLVKMLRKRTLKPFIGYEGGIVYVTAVTAVLTTVLPKVLYGVIYGKNIKTGIRIPAESEWFGLKIIQLLLPVSYSRVGIFRKMSEKYVLSGVAVSENVSSSLGVVATIAFLLLCAWSLFSFISKPVQTDNVKKLDFLALATHVLVLFCTIGGFGTVFNYFITPQIRAYNRVSVVIACLVLAATALVLDKIHNKVFSIGICIVIMCVTCYDQILLYESGWQKPYADSQQQQEAFFAQIETCVGEGGMVYELPHMNFPEEVPKYNMQDYTPFLGYIFTDSIKWSYGGVKGRNDEAESLHIDEGKSLDFVDGVKAVGFSGIYIDTYGFEDNGIEIVNFYQSLGMKEIVSADGRFYFYSLKER